MTEFEFNLQRFFTFAGESSSGSTGVNVIRLTSSNDTLESATANTKIYPYSSGEETLTYNDIKYTINNAGGNAFFSINESGGLDFVFVDKGDSITIPEEASAIINLYYIDKSSAAYVTNPNSVEPVVVPTVPVITGSESYTVTMTTATSRRSARAEFTVSDIGAESYVEFGDYPFQFSAAGGNFTFNQQGQVTDITAASGDVIFYNEATSFLSQVDNNDRPLLTLDGSTLYIDAVTFEYNDNTLVYNHDDKSLFGLANVSIIRDAGVITKIYAPSAQGIFKFGDGSNAQIFSAWGADGNIDNPDNRAYFTVDGDKVTGFTFAAVDDQLTGNYINLTLTDAPTGNTFAAPVLTVVAPVLTVVLTSGQTHSDLIIGSTIIKTVEKINGTNKDCYAFLGQELEGVTAHFADGTSVTFNAVNDYTELLFTTTGKLLTILNLSAGNEIAIDNAANSFYIDGNEIEITGGGFTYRKINARTTAIVDLKAGATVRKATGVNQILTVSGDDGNGTFTFGNNSYEVSGNVDGVIFNIDRNGNVTSIDGINGGESVKKVGSTTAIYDDNTSSTVTLASGIVIGDASTRTKAIKIVGNALDNSILGGSGKDSLYGKDGDDHIDGGKGNDKISGANGNDYLYGGAGNDSLSGGNGNDTLDGGTGNDTLTGGAGKDIFIYNGEGNDVITDMTASDTLQIGDGTGTYSKEIDDSDIIVTVGDGFVTLKGAASLSALNIDGEEVSPIENYDDSSAAKVTLAANTEIGDASNRMKAIYIVGNALDNTIFGGSGKDSLYGKDGNDYIDGGVGNDKISGANGDDYLDGGSGNDSLSGGNGNDTLDGSFGNDTLTGGAGKDLFVYYNGEGNDVITDMTASDTLRIGDGSDTYSKEISGNNIILTVGDGNITLKGAASLSALNILGEEFIPLETYDDSSAAKVTLAADTEVGDASARTKAIYIVGNALDNSIVGGSGKDSLYGKDGDDHIDGGKSNDKISGANGNDYLYGNGGNDSLSGGNGNDTLHGGTGNDTLTGGKGNDLFIYTAGNDVITDYAAGDKISLGAAVSSASLNGANAVLTIGKNTLTVKNAKELTLIDSTGKELTTILGGLIAIYDDGDDVKQTLPANVEFADASGRTKSIIITGNALNNSIVGSPMNDTLWGSTGNDTLTGGGGNDLFVYSAGNDVITDYAAGDKISLGAELTGATLNGSNAVLIFDNGLLTVEDAKDLTLLDTDGTVLNTVIGNATPTDASITISRMASTSKTADMSTFTKSVAIFGNALDNSIVGSNKADTIFGADGNDSLVGNAGADKLYGQNGDDTLWGGAGYDTLDGGNGADVFIYNSGEGKDVIEGFGDDDLLQITGTFSAAYKAATNTVAIKVGSTANAVTLKDFTATTFNINGTAYQINEGNFVKKINSR